jgi:hypothetical protein
MVALRVYSGWFGAAKMPHYPPPLCGLSDKVQSFFFTNNVDLAEHLPVLGWIVELLPDWACLDKHGSTLQSKLLRCLPQIVDPSLIESIDTLMWCDYGLRIDSDVQALIATIPRESIGILRHPCSVEVKTADSAETRLWGRGLAGVWDEYNLAMSYIRYEKDRQRYKEYIEYRSSWNTDTQVLMGGITIRKDPASERVLQFGRRWLEEIDKCGAEDQISLQFLAADLPQIHILEQSSLDWTRYY